jgi:predicted nucleic acid-binding protein
MIQNNEGRTALHLAASNSCLDQVPPEFLAEDTLSVADCYGKPVIHQAAEYGTIYQIPHSALTRKLMSLKNKRGDTVSDLIEQNRPTQKQIDYLKALGVSFDLSLLTKARASGLIESALCEQRSKESPSEKQLAMVQRLGLVSELKHGASKQDVTELLDHATMQAATAAQIQKAESLGLTLKTRDEFTIGDLDKLLKLADRRPSPKDENDLSRLCITSFGGTALEARMLLALAMIFETEFLGMDDDESSVARACIAAARDNEFGRATISAGSDFTPDWEVIRWPKVKLREWWKAGRRPARG